MAASKIGDDLLYKGFLRCATSFCVNCKPKHCWTSSPCKPWGRRNASLPRFKHEQLLQLPSVSLEFNLPTSKWSHRAKNKHRAQEKARGCYKSEGCREIKGDINSGTYSDCDSLKMSYNVLSDLVKGSVIPFLVSNVKSCKSSQDFSSVESCLATWPCWIIDLLWR